MSSNFCQIGPLTSELSALERKKKIKLLSCGHFSAFTFYQIFFILAGNEDNQQVWTEFKF